jgi:hypothetical protein
MAERRGDGHEQANGHTGIIGLFGDGGIYLAEMGYAEKDSVQKDGGRGTV